MIHHPIRLIALIALSSNAFALQNPAPVEMIPLPQSALARAGSFSVTSQMRIILGDGVTAKDFSLAERFADIVQRHIHRRPTLTSEGPLRKLTKGSFYLATPASDFARSALSAQEIRRLGSASPDEYFLDIRQEGIVLLARTEAGRFYGMMTLFALLRPEGRRLVLPCVTVRDWPDRPVRGLSVWADWSPAWAFDRLRRLFPLCGLLKLNTIVLHLPDDARARSPWTHELRRVQPLAWEHGIELTLDSSAKSDPESFGPTLRLGFLPPGPGITSSIALAARRENSPPRPFVPGLILEEPVPCSSDWLEYCAAWIAQNSWSSAQANLGSFNRVYFRGLTASTVGTDEWHWCFSALQNCRLEASWEELWVRPSLAGSCGHRVMRRHAAESLTAELKAQPEHDAPPLHSAISLRIRFLDFIAARLRAEDVLAELGGHQAPASLDAVRVVVESIDQLEAALLEAHGQQPVKAEFLDLVGAAAFQRGLWSQIGERIESSLDCEDLMPPRSWMSSVAELDSVPGEFLEFRRRFQCTETPFQAKLVLSSLWPVVATSNGSVHTGAPRLMSEAHPSHPPTWVIDLTDHVTSGENLLLLAIQTADGRSRAVSARVELCFRNGAAATFGVDSLWDSRTVPQNQTETHPDTPWTGIRITENLACQSGPPGR